MFRKILSPVSFLVVGSSVQRLATSSNAFVDHICRSPLLLASRHFQTSQHRYDLMEFFDNKKNWGESQVRTGRSWKVDELRIKSNTDLHKLWYILLKERNMLMTMEAECKRAVELFPNPERLDKVPTASPVYL